MLLKFLNAVRLAETPCVLEHFLWQQPPFRITAHKNLTPTLLLISKSAETRCEIDKLLIENAVSWRGIRLLPKIVEILL